ncbi:hypothetical protein [Phaeobacter sp. J2-8]|uniref:WD40/YVTN/BNR-like repeat-containing protein n=1 Tax=Phaeobacter sp. J2-8 TaxID=2931394 RepID=UPI0032AEA253
MAETTLLIGTNKGAFLLNGNADRQQWSVTGPFCDGWRINHMTSDPETGTIWAAGGGEFFGAGVWRTDDGGQTWTLSKLADGQLDERVRNDPEAARLFDLSPAPPAPFSGQIDALWSVHHTPNAIYVGAKPAQLFASKDGGTTWEKLTAA